MTPDQDSASGLEDSDRIDRRIAHGVYRITHNKRDIGEELWGVFGLRDGGYRLMSEVDLTWPIANQQRVRLDLDAMWSARSLWAQIDANATRYAASFTVDDHEIEVEVRSQPLRYADTQRANHDRFKEAAATKLEVAERLPRTANTLLDYASTLLNFAHLRLLKLPEGGSVNVRTIAPAQPTLQPLIIEQTYTFTRIEQITSALSGYATARRYVITESADRAPITTLWTDEHDIALRLEILAGAETHGCELTAYTWNG
jgi:hypothetical protein